MAMVTPRTVKGSTAELATVQTQLFLWHLRSVALPFLHLLFVLLYVASAVSRIQHRSNLLKSKLHFKSRL